MHIIFTSDPTVFGEKHLIGSFVVVVIMTLLLILLRDTKKFNPKKVLKFTTLFLISLELLKYSHALILRHEFPLNFIPMQLCSFSLYLMPIVAFGNEKWSKRIMPVSYTIGLVAGLLVLLYPTTVLGGTYTWFPLADNVIPMISFIYHGTMVFFALYLVQAKLYKPSFKDFGFIYLSLLIFAGFAVVTNLIFDTDMMFLNTGSGNPFQFVLTSYGRILYMLVLLVLAAILLSLPHVHTLFKKRVDSRE